MVSLCIVTQLPSPGNKRPPAQAPRQPRRRRQPVPLDLGAPFYLRVLSSSPPVRPSIGGSVCPSAKMPLMGWAKLPSGRRFVLSADLKGKFPSIQLARHPSRPGLKSTPAAPIIDQCSVDASSFQSSVSNLLQLVILIVNILRSLQMRGKSRVL